MIVRMKKVTLLVTESEREAMLKGLRALGVLHIRHIHEPVSENIDEIEEHITQANRVIQLLDSCQPKSRAQKITWTREETQENIRKIIGLYNEQQSAYHAIDTLKQQMEYFKPWGGFDPADIKELSQKGVHVRLYLLNRGQLKQVAGRDDMHILHQDKYFTYAAQLSKNPDTKPAFKELPLPKQGLGELHKQYEILSQRASQINGILSSYADAQEHIAEYAKSLEKNKRFLSVKHGMAAESKFFYLQGFVPFNKQADISVLCKAHKAGYIIDEPKDTDEVPTLVKNPRWVDIISPVFKFMNTVPGYAEYDISLWFLMFFSLFFAMLIGDAGYGILFLLATFLARRKFRKVASQPFLLLYVLSIATIIWGAVTGTWFGAERFARIPLLSSVVIKDISSFADNNQNLMIFICFTIGVIQLTIAHLIIGLRHLNTLKAFAELGWIFVLWGLYFVAGNLVLARELPAATAYLFIAGISLLLLFNNLKGNILKNIGASLTDVPLKIISSFGDVVSYLRLFAVGYASVVLAGTFNSMAMSVGFDSIVTSLGSALILFLGHGLNIILGFMAVIVHGVRLNMLEFSGQMGMEWSGKEYAPFKE